MVLTWPFYNHGLWAGHRASVPQGTLTHRWPCLKSFWVEAWRKGRVLDLLKHRGILPAPEETFQLDACVRYKDDKKLCSSRNERSGGDTSGGENAAFSNCEIWEISVTWANRVWSTRDDQIYKGHMQWGAAGFCHRLQQSVAGRERNSQRPPRSHQRKVPEKTLR